MVLLPNSLGIRIAGILLAAMVLFNLFMVVALYAPIGRERAWLTVLPLPAQAAAIIDLIETTPAQERDRVLDALNSPALNVKLLDRLPASGHRPSRAPLEALLSGYDKVFANHEFEVELQRYRPLRRLFSGNTARDWVPVRLFVRLHDGPYVLIEPARAALFDRFLARGLMMGGLGGLVLMIGLFFAVRQTARPVTKLAENARAFADRLDAPDLVESGPKELRDLAISFNHMKARIRALVGERTRVLAAIAHDLRTYLTRLRLRADFIPDPDQRARAERDLDEMARLIDDTLLFAQESAQAKQTQARADLTAEIVALIAERAELGQPVLRAAPLPDAAWASVDPLALRRILANLVDNALRYGELARVWVRDEEKSWVIGVEDDGPGIPEADLERVTAPFERLETSRGRAGGGAGLGLAIVRALTESQGGRLILRNRAPRGLCAEVHLAQAGPGSFDNQTGSFDNQN